MSINGNHYFFTTPYMIDFKLKETTVELLEFLKKSDGP